MRVAASLARSILPPEARLRAAAAVLDAAATVPTLVGRAAWAASQGLAWVDAQAMDARTYLWEVAGVLRERADGLEERAKAPAAVREYLAQPPPHIVTLRALVEEELRQRRETLAQYTRRPGGWGP